MNCLAEKRPKKHVAGPRTKRTALFTLTDDDFRDLIPDVAVGQSESKPGTESFVLFQAQKQMTELELTNDAEKKLSGLIPNAIAKKFAKAIPQDFELSHIEISGELSAKLLGVGASGTVSITYTRKKPT
jgi:hypothetical protein